MQNRHTSAHTDHRAPAHTDRMNGLQRIATVKLATWDWRPLVCVYVSGDMSPYCSAHDEWLIMKLCMYVRYHTANNVSNVGGDPVTQLSFKSYNA